MAANAFLDFCNSLCEQLGVLPPELQPDAAGRLGFTVSRGRAHVGFADDQRNGVPAVLMAVAWGKAGDSSHQDELCLLRAALDMNLKSLGPVAPAFMRDAADGQLWLCRWTPLAQLQVQEVRQSLDLAADMHDELQSSHRHSEPVAVRPGAAELMNLMYRA